MSSSSGMAAMTPGSSVRNIFPSTSLAHSSALLTPPLVRSQPATALALTFTVTNITGTTTLDLQDGATYRGVSLPLALLIPLGVNDTTNGTISESNMDILDTTVKNGTFWAHFILYDKAGSDELICCTAEGISKLGNCLILPRLLTGQSWDPP